ncbi:MAG: hypothetical protein KGL25_02050 [Gammaproteobacteria bacterium]|nr:hypothetical protein [Gammaproteobacteria bacterium]
MFAVTVTIMVTVLVATRAVVIAVIAVRLGLRHGDIAINQRAEQRHGKGQTRQCPPQSASATDHRHTPLSLTMGRPNGGNHIIKLSERWNRR